MATHSSIFAWKIPWTEEPEQSDTAEQEHPYAPGAGKNKVFFLNQAVSEGSYEKYLVSVKGNW